MQKIAMATRHCFLAAEKEHSGAIDLLVSKGADVNAALCLATGKGHLGAVELLIKNKADVMLKITMATRYYIWLRKMDTWK